MMTLLAERRTAHRVSAAPIGHQEGVGISYPRRHGQIPVIERDSEKVHRNYAVR